MEPTIENLIETYKSVGSTRKAAEVFQMSDRTFRRRLAAHPKGKAELESRRVGKKP